MMVDAESCYNEKSASPVASLEPHPGALLHKRHSDRQRPDSCTGVTMTIAKLEADREKLDRGDAPSLGGLAQPIGSSQPQPGYRQTPRLKCGQKGYDD